MTLPDESFDLRDKIQTAIDTLPDPLRIVFVLHRFEEHTYGDIAEVLDISVKTVEGRMSRALRLLREQLRSLLSITFFLFFHKL